MPPSPQPESNPDTWADHAQRIGWQIAGAIHAGSAWLLTRLGRLAERVLKPFPWSCRFSVLAAAIAIGYIYLGTWGEGWLIRAAKLEPDHLTILENAHVLETFRNFQHVLILVGIGLVVCSLAAFARIRPTLWLLKAGGAAAAVMWCWALMFVVSVPTTLYHGDAEIFDKFMRNTLWLFGIAWWLPGAILILLFLIGLVLTSTLRFYTRETVQPEDKLLGDRIVDDVKTHGGDPTFRTSWYWSAFSHLSVLFLLPLLMRGCMEDAYGIPKGGGEQVQEQVKVEVKKIKKEEMILNVNSPILYYRPKIEDSTVIVDMQQKTENQYEATSLGNLGKGGGKKGGWPHGMENAKVRFIRLEYGGGDWDQQMGKGSDHNLLVQFQKHTGFKIASNTEHIPIRQLRRFPKDRAPPFVFITGSNGISVSSADIKTLRWYCLQEGGLIFADNGGGSFNGSFRSLMRRTFPELDWVDIADDDIIFQRPFLFPNGAPRLWHHSGNRAMGLKHQGRWIVFYHQGDLNDAWQTGHSGVSEHVADQAYKIGINVINYAFNQYYSIHFGE